VTPQSTNQPLYKRKLELCCSAGQNNVVDGLWGIPPFFVERGPQPTPPNPAPFDFRAPTTASNALRVLRALQLKKAVLLEGSPGVGKTSLVAALAAAIGQCTCVAIIMLACSSIDNCCITVLQSCCCSGNNWSALAQHKVLDVVMCAVLCCAVLCCAVLCCAAINVCYAFAGQKLVRINLSEQTDMMDLLGADLPVEGGAPGQFAW